MSTSKKRRRTPSAAMPTSLALNVARREFERWLASRNGIVADEGRATLLSVELFRLTERAQISLLEPDKIDDAISLLLDADEHGDELLDILHDYLHFRVETAPDHATFVAWEAAHSHYENTVEELDQGVPAVVQEAMDADALLDPDVRRDAVSKITPVAQVAALLEWIGKGRTLTTTGSLRRIDIEPVAALLGVSAIGGARSGRDATGARVVQSMWDLPELGAWWETLIMCRLIEVAGTRLRLGTAALDWGQPGAEAAEAAEAVAMFFIMNLLNAQGPSAAYEAVWVGVRALDPSAPVPTPIDDVEVMLAEFAHEDIAELEQWNIVTTDGFGNVTVPEALRGLFARALTFTMAVADRNAGLLSDEPDADALPDSMPSLRGRAGGPDVVHVPGMAADMLNKLAPLLAEDGFDIDNIADIDAFQDALTRAAERYNLELQTPIGPQRESALQTLRTFAIDTHEGFDADTWTLAESIPPETESDTATVAQVIGTGAGLLDSWGITPPFLLTVARVPAPGWAEPSRRAMRDVLRRAADRGAFDATGELILQYGGEATLHAVLVAVATTVIALADADRIDVTEAVARYIR
ncbi:hypothetical protein [Microbacterium sp. ZW T5_56]|uniref:hypothetical protein n=1 Tax=Microbacterium sp. ZW T5_56 TaxID=3378081 RepID=UPI003854D0AD